MIVFSVKLSFSSQLAVLLQQLFRCKRSPTLRHMLHKFFVAFCG